MRISPININKYPFRADARIDTETGEYKDPMMHWPLRGAAFTNEIGEALRPLIGQYATLTWIPALMYIGADIYDKYKNLERFEIESIFQKYVVKIGAKRDKLA